MQERIRKIANHYGFEEQSRILMEECAELIQAVNKYHRRQDRLRRKNVFSEIADVKIMCEQISYLLSAEENEIEEIIEQKVQRQEFRIKENEMWDVLTKKNI